MNKLEQLEKDNATLVIELGEALNECSRLRAQIQFLREEIKLLNGIPAEKLEVSEDNE